MAGDGFSVGERRRAGQDGISLVEVLVAMSILGVVMTAFAQLVIGSLRSLALSEAQQRAHNAAVGALEYARVLNFDEVAHPWSIDDPDLPFGLSVFVPDGSGDIFFDPGSGTLADPGGSSPTAEKVFLDKDGGRVTPEEGYWARSDDLELYTIVTLPPDASAGTQVRVTVVVEFEVGGQREVLRQSTLISFADQRGLEQPKFTVDPVSAGVQIQRGYAGDRHCVKHTITNDVPDEYDVHHSFVDGYEITFTEVRDGIEVPLVPGTAHVPGSWTTENPQGEPVELKVCFGAAADAVSVDEVVVTIRSREAWMAFEHDPLALASRSQQLVYGLNVETERVLYLASRGEEMRDPTVPYATTPDLPTPSGLANFDVNIDGRAGLLLPRAAESSDTWAARWRHALGPERELTEAQLRFWYGSPAGYDGLLDLSPPEPELDPDDEGDGAGGGGEVGVPVEHPREVILRVQLRRLDPTGAPLAVLHETVVTLPVEDATWRQHDLDLTVPPGTRLDAGDDLELMVACDPSSPSDCLLAFGTQSFPARLLVRFP